MTMTLRSHLMIWQCIQPVAGPSRTNLYASRTLLPIRTFVSTPVPNSGHNKWSKIKHKKGAADAAKSVLYGRIIRDLQNSLRPPNSLDPTINSRLADIMGKAKEVGMPKSVVERAISRAQSVLDGTGQSQTFEMMGPTSRDAYIVECLTDNPNRTIQSLRGIAKARQARITPVGFMFERKGSIIVQPATPQSDFDALFELVLEEGADDVKEVEGEESLEWEVVTPLELLSKITTSITSDPEKRFSVRSSDPAYIPLEYIEAPDEDAEPSDSDFDIEKASLFCSMLEEDQDVVRVWTNIRGL
ncbi:transcriptional regulator TACO1-like protein [Kockovaella imperatae]|uniref:Transcriptional regulator TACO1-like protein n=1 Tax=Kockovaella imperatae TaxID=4999 RepID=A0A1Y1UK98_9TREE|nr:transcriptional regulator TACO1-like protein [Kockovaella imperatae]ORX38419.1 transcriptional regulator TACO1-like protein [Kockovaella imperatae]